MALKIKGRMEFRIGNSEFEDNIFSWVRVHPHPVIPGKPVRFLGAKQVLSLYPHFRFFVANPKSIIPSFNRYLKNKIYETYNFEGCPVVLEFRSAKRPKKKPALPSGPSR
jgi:GTP-binding protein